ncbi:MAG: DUF4190 domain-containing protein [Bacillota bacterium]|nr:DUF4190 domain-containing protein [Bacillota bacterium]MDW7730528.1 DUF4190 domain-containing protein [Bacillota bacterium]
MDDNTTSVIVEQPNNTLGTVSLVTGILAAVFFLCCPYLAVILGLAALICGIIGMQRQQKYSLVGIILGAVGIVLGIIFAIIGQLLFSELFNVIQQKMYRY